MHFASVLLSASTAGDSVSVGELLCGLRGHHRVGALKRRLTEASGKSRPLKPPLPKPQAERVRKGMGGGVGELEEGRRFHLVTCSAPAVD